MAATERASAAAAMAAVFGACAALQGWDAHAQSGDSLNLRWHDYDEGEFTGQLAEGSPRRYQVRTAQASLQLSVRGDFLLQVDALNESMSGSSPWFALPDDDGRPLQVMSGASIADHRRELAVSLSSPLEQPIRHGLHVQGSSEDDYRARAAGYQWTRALDAQHSVSLGIRHSDDQLRPTDAELFDRVSRAGKRSSAAFASVSQVLDRNRQQQFGIGFEQSDGFLSDPYKLVLVGSRLLHDQRPDQRQQLALYWRYRQAVLDGDAAVHVDYRGSRDDWGITAHELELRWQGELPGAVEWGPSLRYYSQTAARFYAPFQLQARADGDASSDYRLGRFGAFSLGLSLRRQFGPLALELSAERYRSDETYALGGADAAIPALVDFRRLSLAVDWSF